MKYSKLVLSTAAAVGTILGVGAASAADMAVKARPAPPPPPPVANWTGCYIAGSVGYGLFDNETSAFGIEGSSVFQTLPRHDQGGRGWLAGGGGGCDYQFGFGGGGGFFGTGQFVIGLLADGYWANMRGGRASVAEGSFATGQEKITSHWAVGGRIGWLVNPNTLTYFSGGYTEAHLNGVGEFFFADGDFLGRALPSATVKGWFLGGGVEYQSGWIPNLNWQTEYRFSEYDRIDRPEFFNTPPLTPTGLFSSDKLFVQTVMTSLVYRFNWGIGKQPVVARY